MWMQGEREWVGLLPDSDDVVYVNLAPLRVVNVFTSLKKVAHDQDYENFIEQTGFDFERDLDEVGIAVHLPSAPPDANAPAGAAQATRFSEVLKGHFDHNHANASFPKISRRTEHNH